MSARTIEAVRLRTGQVRVVLDGLTLTFPGLIEVEETFGEDVASIHVTPEPEPTVHEQVTDLYRATEAELLRTRPTDEDHLRVGRGDWARERSYNRVVRNAHLTGYRFALREVLRLLPEDES